MRKSGRGLDEPGSLDDMDDAWMMMQMYLKRGETRRKRKMYLRYMHTYEERGI